MVRPGEPMWLEEDREKMLAYFDHKSSICPNCGTREQDWVDENGRFLDPPRYEAASRKCFGCAELDRMREAIPEKEKGIYVIAQRFYPGESRELEELERFNAERLAEAMTRSYS